MKATILIYLLVVLNLAAMAKTTSEESPFLQKQEAFRLHQLKLEKENKERVKDLDPFLKDRDKQVQNKEKQLEEFLKNKPKNKYVADELRPGYKGYSEKSKTYDLDRQREVDRFLADKRKSAKDGVSLQEKNAFELAEYGIEDREDLRVDPFKRREFMAKGAPNKAGTPGTATSGGTSGGTSGSGGSSYSGVGGYTPPPPIPSEEFDEFDEIEPPPPPPIPPPIPGWENRGGVPPAPPSFDPNTGPPPTTDFDF